MKKYILICIGVLLLCSCRSTYLVTPQEDYIEYVRAFNQSIALRGYQFTGCDCDTTLVRDYNWGGYLWQWDRNYNHRYTFVDSVGDTVEYSFIVNYGSTELGDLYIDSAVVTGCRVTKSLDTGICSGPEMALLTNPPVREVSWKDSRTGPLITMVSGLGALVVVFVVMSVME